jgi:hypothetical protein
MQLLTTALTRRKFLRNTAAATVTLTVVPPLCAERPSAVSGPNTAVRRQRGRPRFMLDGESYTKPVFETYVPELKYFRQLTEAGTDVFSFSTNLGDGFAAPTWLGPKAWVFRQLDELAHRLERSARQLRDPRHTDAGQSPGGPPREYVSQSGRRDGGHRLVSLLQPVDPRNR